MSREPRPFAVFGFESTHDALAAENLLGDARIEVVPIPAPAALGALCGIALRVPESSLELAVSRLKEGGIEPTGIIRMDDV
jgi:hypothetical protein